VGWSEIVDDFGPTIFSMEAAHETRTLARNPEQEEPDPAFLKDLHNSGPTYDHEIRQRRDVLAQLVLDRLAQAPLTAGRYGELRKRNAGRGHRLPNDWLVACCEPFDVASDLNAGRTARVWVVQAQRDIEAVAA